ncbi:MAG: transcriptional regulator, partial [Hafnia sp.]
HEQHQGLLDAVLGRDAVRAGELMYQHLLTPIPIIRGAMG